MSTVVHAPSAAAVRYETLAEIGVGGMATVHYGRLHAAHGFVRSVAIKRLHEQFARDPKFVAMFIDEALIAARLTHANIVATLDVIAAPGELGLVLEYVHGESLWNLLCLSRQYGKPMSTRVAAAIAVSVLHGLHAAHEAEDEVGRPLGVVHRDVSPHNILVGGDGIPRVIDFGVAKAVGRLHATPSGEIKGKLLYMAPEQLSAGVIDRRADVYGAAAVLWETLTGRAPWDGPSESEIIHAILLGTIDPPGRHRREVSRVLDEIVMRGLRRDPAARFETAREMALALEHGVGVASQSELADWLHDLAGGRLAERARLIAELHEHASQSTLAPRPAELAASRRARVAARWARLPVPSRSYLGLTAAALLLVALVLWVRSHALPTAMNVVAAPGSAPPAVDQEHATSAAEDPELPRGLAPPPAAAEPRPRSTPKRAAAADPKQACQPWFYVDRAGIRRPKPDCL